MTRLLSGVLEVGESVGVEPRQRVEPRQGRPPSRWRRTTLLVAAALLFAGAAAATWEQVSATPKEEVSVSVGREVRPLLPLPKLTSRHPIATRIAPVAAPSSTASAVFVQDRSELTPAVEAVSAGALVPRKVSRALTAQGETPAAATKGLAATLSLGGTAGGVPPLATTAVTLGTTEPRASSSTPTSEAGELFVRANEARRAGDHGHATELYRALGQRFPGSPEAQESRAVLGRMLLDDGDTTAALRSFDDYLRTAGVLREDVMVDRALTLERLGRRNDEANAWASLLRAYPSSVHAERARARLRQLGDPCVSGGEGRVEGCDSTRPR